MKIPAYGVGLELRRSARAQPSAILDAYCKFARGHAGHRGRQDESQTATLWQEEAIRVRERGVQQRPRRKSRQPFDAPSDPDAVVIDQQLISSRQRTGRSV